MMVSRASAYGLHALMYMVRHVTSLPATVEAMAKTEGMPVDPLRTVLEHLTAAGFVRLDPGCEDGYVFARPPDEIVPRELMELCEGQPPFDDRAEDGQTRQEHGVSAEWASRMGRLAELSQEPTIVTAAWKDLGHRFGAPARATGLGRLPIRSIDSRGRPYGQESHTWG